MDQPEFNPRLFHTKRGALIALCFTGYVVALIVRDVLWHSQRQHHWLVDLDWLAYWYISLPAWVVAGVNLTFYAALLWGGVLLYRIAQGKERVLVVAWATLILLGLVQTLTSASAAAAIDLVKAFTAAVAFFAAVDICLKMPSGGYPQIDNQASRNA